MNCQVSAASLIGKVFKSEATSNKEL